MASRRGIRRKLVDERKVINRKIDQFANNVEYLLNQYEKIGVPRDSQCPRRTLEENYRNMTSTLRDNLDKYQGNLSETLRGYYLDAYDYIDAFLEAENERGIIEDDGFLYTADMEAQSIAVKILSRLIRNWDKEDIEELRDMRLDLRKALADTGEHLCNYRYGLIQRYVSTVPTAEVHWDSRELDIIAVDTSGRMLIARTEERIYDEESYKWMRNNNPFGDGDRFK